LSLEMFPETRFPMLWLGRAMTVGLLFT